LKLNKEAPINYTFMSEKAGNGTIEGLGTPGKLPVEFSVPKDQIKSGDVYQVTLTFAYCTDENQGLCVPVTLPWRLSLTADDKAENTATLSAQVPPL
jgi:hypothetical protein